MRIRINNNLLVRTKREINLKKINCKNLKEHKKLNNNYYLYIYILGKT